MKLQDSGRIVTLARRRTRAGASDGAGPEGTSLTDRCQNSGIDEATRKTKIDNIIF